MKLQRRKNKQFIILGAVITIVIAGAVYLWLRKTSSHENAQFGAPQSSTPRGVNDVNYSPPTNQDKQEQDAQKQQIIDQTAQQPGSTPSSISVAISRASQSAAGQPLTIRTIVNGVTSGSCEVTLSKSGQPTITKSFTVTAQATYATCTDAQVAADEFSANGTWMLQVVAKNGSAASAPVTQDVTITK